ncbi:ATP-binding protein [Amycolatopsis sp. cmx-11-12]|uniref:ATP-binding protein n=1 Tax=Amycolatopsis sp. cmx-11-12 TaxID=2785795 RepID=UPI003916ED37
MAERANEVRNNVGGEVDGPVVQAGSIQHVSLTDAVSVEHGVPRQLPLAVRDFTGRVEQIAALEALLPPGSDVDLNSNAGAASVVISVVDGAGGIGKTTLAVWWAHRVQHRFPDGTLYVNLRGYGPGDPATPSEVLEGFLRALGLPAERIPIGVEAQAGAFRSLLAGRRALLLLDNAHHADQVRPLLPGAPGCVVLVTSRDRLAGLVITEAATRLSLDLLTQAEALELVTGIVGPERAAAEPDALQALVRYCARWPLALRIAASQAAGLYTIADVVAELADDRYRLDVLSQSRDDRATVRTVFDWSYHRLTAPQAQAFRQLGLHPGAEFSVEVAAAATELALRPARRVLQTLVDAHLVEHAGRGRYRLHDLLRTYADDRATTDDTSEERDATRQRIWQWYAHHAKAANNILWPALRDWHPAFSVPTRTRPEIDLADAEQAWAWFVCEEHNLITVAHSTDRHDHAALNQLLAATSMTPLWRLGRWDDLFNLQQRALAAARRQDNRLTEAHFLSNLGAVQRATRQWQDSHDSLQAALALAHELGDLGLEVFALNDLGILLLNQGRYEQARQLFQDALQLAPGFQSGRLEAAIECNLSQVCIGLGDHVQALHHAHRGLARHRRARGRNGEAAALVQLAKARQGLGEHHEAIALCEQAREVEANHRYPLNTAEILATLSISLDHTGHTARAHACWQDALAIYDQYGDPRAVALRQRHDATRPANSESQ